ncbi:TadE/TadG family type IV pilus assembly protein [Sphingobium bisphenolivorans]|uniref:TadE/TadG family type IV pilus assembly protein n=1 Tax=Sphingobium bisphenolivorans TaxID=1335760 RepID=UPI0003A3652B|nr:TadE/TadG family type IV pilus assembly protein [Sphingobium bisphenolivorans]
MRLLFFLRKLVIDQKGTSVLELALILPVLAMLTFVAADIAMAFKAKITLQRAAERAGQMATSGGYNSTAYQNLAADAASAAGVSSSNVTVTDTLLCDGTAQAATTPCAAGQQISRYVGITVNGTYMPMFAGLLPGSRWSSGQGVALTGAASVRLQ